MKTNEYLNKMNFKSTPDEMANSFAWSEPDGTLVEHPEEEGLH